MSLIVDIEGIRKLGLNLQQDGADYDMEINKIYGQIDQLANAWQGPDNQAYITKVNELKETIKALGNTITECGTHMTRIATKYQAKQDAIKTAVERL